MVEERRRAGDDAMHERITALDRATAQAVTALTREVEKSAHQIDEMMGKIDNVRDDVHAVQLSFARFDTPIIKDKVDDHERRLRETESWQQRAAGKQAVYALLISGAMSLLVMWLSKMLHLV